MIPTLTLVIYMPTPAPPKSSTGATGGALTGPHEIGPWKCPLIL